MPSWFAAVSPVRMNPACAMLEYASIRFTSRLRDREHAADDHRDGRQHPDERRPVPGERLERRRPDTRISARNAATFVAADMNAVTGVGRALVHVGRPHVERHRARP